MVKQTNNVQPIVETDEPQVHTPEAIVADVQENGKPDTGNSEGADIPDDTAANFAAMLQRRNQTQELRQNKQQLISEITTALDDVVKLDAQGKANSDEATEKSGVAAFKLYQGWTSGALDAAQVTEILGRKFGAKEKGNGKVRVPWAGSDKASSTPFGMGEAIRKRVVRAVRAHEFVTSEGTEGVAFFDTLDVSSVRAELNKVNSGQGSINTLYESLAKLKTEASTGNRPAMAFDPARITKLTDKLGENLNNTLLAIASNEALFNAYADLRDMINVCFDELETRSQAIAA